MNFLLKDLRWHSGLEMLAGDVRISGGIITEAGVNLPSKKNEYVESFKGQFLYPGLINAHDHLEMNLYPALGAPPYRNYVEWAKDIYKPSESPVREIEKLSIRARLLWGGLKNLMAGVTTVIHHNPWHRSMGNRNFPVKVLKIAWAHSLAFEKNISKKFPAKKNVPFVIHAAEGIDTFASSEIASLKKLNMLGKNTVLIHAVGLNEESVETVKNSQVAIVWCPASNLFMFHRTAPVHELKNKVLVALGSDSTLTGSPTLLHEMQVAGKTNLASAREIFEMVTRVPAEVFHLPSPLIAAGYPADLLVSPMKSRDYYDNLLTLRLADMSLVMKNGVPCLKNMDAENNWQTLKYQVRIDGAWKYCALNVSGLKKEIENTIPAVILDRNPLWKLVET